MAHEFRMVHTVEFVDTDMAGIMHFASFFRYMEITEHAFLRSLGLSVYMPDQERRIGWPRVHASCDYLSPLRFEDRVEVHLTVREKREKLVAYDFVFRKLGEGQAEAEVVARGALKAVCVAIEDPDCRGEPARLKSVPIPEPFTSRVQAIAKGE